ncbi:MAG: NADH:ubiquinone reductase (Na(+)-transporting) subunit C [Hyphomicrobiales bacterium]|nr:NADH:ubiquinone reductase (Na(+)-transporting) subunit C [Hyphomicrobiales bacterium]
MVELFPLRLWRRLLALPNTSRLKAIIVVLLVSSICAVFVSVTAVVLRPFHQANLEAARQAHIETLLQSIPGADSRGDDSAAPSVSTVLVDLVTGSIVEGLDPLGYDQRAAAADFTTSIAIPDEADIAGIGRRAKHAPVHFIRRRSELELVILPVRGAGYQSMLYGYLALKPDLKSVAALTFYEQAETPGLGDRITDPAWLSKWPGTRIADEEGNLRIAVAQGQTKRSYEVDGISGATRTGNGVTNLLRFWLGDLGFGPFLKRLAAGEIKP